MVEIEGKTGVFVPSPASAGRPPTTVRSHFRPIEVGREAGDRVVVKSGLKEGEAVVAGGAYQLKSELILQNQTEEE